MASETTSSSSPKRWPRWLPIAGWSLLALLGVAFFGYTFTVMFGAVHGIEFSPQSFERRSYSFYEVPLLGIQLTAKREEDLSSNTETFLTSNKYIVPPASGKKDWHIVVGSRGPRLQRKGDAAILIQYLDAKDAQEYHRWVKWSEDHPQQAKVFWPALQILASHELYVFVPALFELTKGAEDVELFRQALDREVADRLLFLKRRLDERGDHEAAQKVEKEAAALDAKK
jgi:hypothetical protein